MKIDVHAHIIGPAYYGAINQLPGVTSVPSNFGRSIVKDGEIVISISQDWFDPHHHVREMDKRGIDVSLLSLTTPNLYVFPKEMQAEAARLANDEAVERAREFPDRIRVLASLPLDDVPAAIQEIDRVAALREVCGIAVGSMMFGTDYPYTQHGPGHVESLPISAEDKTLMLGGNAERVFQLN